MNILTIQYDSICPDKQRLPGTIVPMITVAEAKTSLGRLFFSLWYNDTDEKYKSYPVETSMPRVNAYASNQSVIGPLTVR